MDACERTIARFRSALIVGVGFCALAEIAAGVGLAVAPHRTVADALVRGNPFLASAALGAFIIFAATRPARTSLRNAAALAVALEIISAAWFLYIGGSSTLLIPHIGFGFGASGILFAYREYRIARTRDALATLLACCVTPTFILLSITCLDLTIRLHPLTHDLAVYTADAAFGIQPSFFLARLLARAPAIEPIVMLVYIQLPAAFGAVYAAERRHGNPRADVLSSFLLAGLGGFLCYHLLPVVGPRYAFAGAFPDLVPTTCLAPPEPRNCMPSLHTTWALLLYWHARPLGRRARIYTGAWLAITIFATLACGYHYLVDLVVAAPFSLLIRSITMAEPAAFRDKARTAVASGAMVAIWLMLLRAGLAPGPFIVGFALATVAASVAQERRLADSRPGTGKFEVRCGTA